MNSPLQESLKNLQLYLSLIEKTLQDIAKEIEREKNND